MGEEDNNKIPNPNNQITNNIEATITKIQNRVQNLEFRNWDLGLEFRSNY